MNIDMYTEYTVHLLRCAVTGEKARDIPDDIDPEILFRFCCYHKIENTAFFALSKTDTSKIPENVYKLFKQHYNRSIMIDATQQYHLDNVIRAFEENGIDHLILKGRELSCLYPSSDLRQSSDFDIYIGRDNAQKARDIMLGLGFQIKVYSDTDDDHDEYVRDKFVYCELHRVLIQNDHPWKKECNSITDRLIKRSGHCYVMSNEDFYIYNLAHTAKHMKFSGIGIKVFLDLWLILKNYGDKLNWDDVNEKLKRCKLTEFDKKARQLCEYWFDYGEAADDIIPQMSRYVAKSGWAGTKLQETSTELAENAGKISSVKLAKLKKCMDIIFAPYDAMALRYPVLKKKRWLTPFFRIHRAVTAILFKRSLVKNVTSELDGGNMDIGKRIAELKKNMGL